MRRRKYQAMIAAALLAGVTGAAAPGTAPAAAAADAGSSEPASQGKIVRRDAGTWDATIKIAAGSDGGMGVYNGTETNHQVAGGAWLISDFNSRLGGVPFEGHAIFGYDALKKEYVRVWVDSSQAFFWPSEGQYDPSTDSLTMWMETAGPDGQVARWRTVTVWKDEDTRVFTMYAPGPETTDAAGMTITYKRRPSGNGTVAQAAPVDEAPTPAHALLQRLSGVWSARLESADPAGGKRRTSRGTETNRICCGGLFLMTDYREKSNQRLREDRAILGFDPARDRYIVVAAGALETALVIGEGSLDASTDSLTLTVDRPDGTGHAVPVRQVFTWDGPDRRLRTDYLTGPGGEEVVIRSIRYSRRK